MKKQRNAVIMMRVVTMLLTIMMIVTSFAACAGSEGHQGIQGEPGIQGEKGEKGDQGEQGIQGEKGDKGEQGIQGEKGDKGDQGEPGADGDQVEFRTKDTWVQWKYKNDTEWTNLYEIGMVSGNEIATVKLVTNGGSLPENFPSVIESAAGTSVHLPKPTYEGHIFLGWYEENGTEAVSNPYTITEGTSLYTKWQQGEETVIDAFAGLIVNVEGISPYTTLWLNNNNCSEDAQAFISYSFNKEYYKNGEKAIITASLNGTNTVGYSLKVETMEYTVECDEYITKTAGLDLNIIKQAADKYINDRIDESIDSEENYLFDIIPLVETASASFVDVYMLSLKATKWHDDGYKGDKNMITLIYQIEWARFEGMSGWVGPGSGTVYVAITASDIVKNTDNSITWGKEIMGDLQLTCESTDISLIECIDKFVTSKNDNYNITELDIQDSNKKTAIDPFAGLVVNTSGISPYTTLWLNNQDCSELAQIHVSYSFDKEYYKNGDTAVITAYFSYGNTTDMLLSAKTMTYAVTCSYYVTEENGLDLSPIKQAGHDLVSDEINRLVSLDWTDLTLFDYYIGAIDSVVPTFSGAYISALKTNKWYDEGFTESRNMVTLIYQLDWEGGSRDGTIYIAIVAPNAINSTDGIITWGKDVIGDKGLIYNNQYSDVSFTDCVEKYVANKHENYNISEITIE